MEAVFVCVLLCVRVWIQKTPPCVLSKHPVSNVTHTEVFSVPHHTHHHTPTRHRQHTHTETDRDLYSVLSKSIHVRGSERR